MMPAQAVAYQDVYNELLGSYVQPHVSENIKFNAVDYDKWARDAKHDKAVETLLSTELSSLTTTDKEMAFWINAYNLLTIDLIIENDEHDSIENIGGVFSSPWKSKSWTIDGKEYTLDNIEHNILRPMGDARIHFAINCAAISCPDLRDEAYNADILDRQLDDQVAQTFDNETKGLDYDRNEGVLYVTKVMDWFKEDFNNGDPLGWIRENAPIRNFADAELKFFNYDWSLNAQ